MTGLPFWGKLGSRVMRAGRRGPSSRSQWLPAGLCSGILGLILHAATGCGGAISQDAPLGGAPGVGGASAAGGGSFGVGGRGEAGGAGGAGVGGTVGGSGGEAVGGSGGSGGRPEQCAAEAVPGVAALFEREQALAADGSDASFFAFPWPEISRPYADVLGFPNPALALGCDPPAGSGIAALVSGAIDPLEYRQYLSALSANALATGPRHPVIFVAFSGAIDEASLPSVAESLEPSAPVFLMDVDPASSQFGERFPIRTRVYENSHYLPAHTLAVAAAPGFPLPAGTRFALVVRGSLGDAAGNALGSSAAFEAKKLEASCANVDPDYGAVFTFLEQTLGLAREQVAAMTVFQTGTPTAPLDGLLPVIGSTAPSELADVTPNGPADDAGSGVHVLEGTLEVPIQQVGTPPYLPAISVSLAGVTMTFSSSSKDGAFLSSGLATAPGAGDPSAPRTEAVDFVLTLPDAVLTGSSIEDVPLVVYGPGTGGSRYSALDEGIAADLAARAIATVTITPVMHQERAHAENISQSLLDQLALADSVGGTTYQAQLVDTVESGQLFFNPLNLEAARGNSLQAAVDFAWLAQVFSEIVLEANVGGMARSISFDAEHIEFFGHSQGASTGGLLALCSDYNGAVLSGVSGYLPIALLNKTKPAENLGIESMLDYIVCDDPSEPLDETHPFLALLGHFLEPADAELYIGRFTPEVSHTKDLFVITGVGDAYAPAPANHAVTTAARIQELTAPAGVTPNTVGGQALLKQLSPSGGFGVTHASLSANLAYDTTGAFRQYHGASCADDHFVYLCSEAAHADWLWFFETSLTGPPLLPWQP